ncbi:hypothetical protein GCK72_014468 [Caenorhabditis remanei]|uniref:CUB-like domain-containing protein n=1 Tax=Caenorhabditis remanei TaxID=31234 RepID=A0A6A5GRI5_CAERE|nr:hypothetical protein GCK72_014468 [Caenorhabditis remanei]KAF1758010.1 hypothetical protein GCK72_014468 [Caenorhabditis remanei]
MWILFIFLLGAASATIQKSFYECPEHQTITPKYPINTDTIYTFPTKAFTQFPSNSACAWLINIPCNYTVIVQLKATIPDGGHVTVTQTPHLNQTEKFIKDMEVTRFFYPPSFDIFWYPGPSDGGNLKFSLQFQLIDNDDT